jgi:hypothetical protein
VMGIHVGFSDFFTTSDCNTGAHVPSSRARDRIKYPSVLPNKSCAQNEDWKMTVTDIPEKEEHCAVRNDSSGRKGTDRVGVVGRTIFLSFVAHSWSVTFVLSSPPAAVQ